jgi:thiamine pyrophosphokinase
VEQSLNRGNEAEIPYREIRGLKYNLKNNLYFNLCSGLILYNNMFKKAIIFDVKKTSIFYTSSCIS